MHIQSIDYRELQESTADFSDLGPRLMDRLDPLVAIQIHNRFTKEQCAKYIDFLDTESKWQDRIRCEDNVRSLGYVALPRSQFGDFEDYREVLAQLRSVDPAILREAKEGFDLPDSVLGTAQRMFNLQARIGVEQDEELEYLSVNDIHVLHKHFDNTTSGEEIYPDAEIQRATSFGAWNIYLSVSEPGFGKTLIYNQHVDEDVPDTDEILEIQSEVGDLTFINTEMAHAVSRTKQKSDRVAISGFFGKVQDELVFWT